MALGGKAEKGAFSLHQMSGEFAYFLGRFTGAGYAGKALKTARCQAQHYSADPLGAA